MRDFLLGKTNSRLRQDGNCRSLRFLTENPFKIITITHRHPATGVSVVNLHIYSCLWTTTDTLDKKGKHVFYGIPDDTNAARYNCSSR